MKSLSTQFAIPAARRLLGAVAALALTGAVQAASLTTAPWYFGASADYVSCSIVYLGKKKSVEVIIDVFDYNGNVKDSATYYLGPGQSTAMDVSLVDGDYCRFWVKGSPKLYRAMAGYSKEGQIGGFIPAQ